MEHWDYFEPRRTSNCGPVSKKYLEDRLDTLQRILTEKIKESDNAVQSDWTETNSKKLAYIKNKPTIPDAQIQSDWEQTSITALDYIRNKPNLSDVARTGDYNDLSNKPTIPSQITNVSELTNDAGYQTASEVGEAIDNALEDYTPASALGPVATTNNYNDLDNLPAIPVFTVQSTDPGPGGALAENNFIVVYEA